MDLIVFLVLAVDGSEGCVVGVAGINECVGVAVVSRVCRNECVEFADKSKKIKPANAMCGRICISCGCVDVVLCWG